MVLFSRLYPACLYIYAFSRRFYPKRLTVHSDYTFVLISILCNMSKCVKQSKATAHDSQTRNSSLVVGLDGKSKPIKTALKVYKWVSWVCLIWNNYRKDVDLHFVISSLFTIIWKVGTIYKKNTLVFVYLDYDNLPEYTLMYRDSKQLWISISALTLLTIKKKQIL